jgi:two-component system nitrate/nitrite sensor histidine kinase NarX
MPTPTPRPKPDTAILAEITAGLSAGRDLPQLLGRLLEPVVRLAHAQGGAVRLLDETDNQFHLVSQIDPPPHLCRGELQADRHCGFCGVAASEPRVVWAQDLSPCLVDAAPTSVHHMLAVPLQHRSQVLGVYNLFYSQACEPGEDLLALLKSVGELLGMALHNARLEDENLRATLLHERQLMAAEVHDSVAQSLAFVKMRLPLLRDAMQTRDDPRALQYFDELRGAVSQAHASLRGVLTQFRAPMDPQGLVHALAASAQTFRRSTGAELEVVNELPGLQLPPDHESQVFHIVQEALNNVARHAAAQHAWLHIAAAPGRADAVQVLVADDGAGLPAQLGTQSSHYGLSIMQERARRIGGTLEVGPRPGGGTVVRLTFTLAAAHGATPQELH